MIFIWHNLFFIRHDKNEEEEGHEKGEVDMIQMLDIVQKLSIDPTFLSLLHDLMHKQRLEFCIRFRSANAEVAFETHEQIWPKMQ